MTQAKRLQNRFDVVRTTTTLTFPIVLMFAGSHIINASQLPGEGFSAGLLVALSVVLLHVGVGHAEVERDLPRYVRWAAPLGLGIALFVGLVGLGVHGSFLWHASVHVPLWSGEIKLSSTSLFDIAVFLVVAGGAHDISRAIGALEPSS